MLSSSHIPWFMAFVATVIVVGTIVGVVQRRRKTRRMAEFAQAQGWHYTPTDPSLTRRYEGSPFGTGSSRRAAHVMTGHHQGTPFTIFEYRYTHSDGDDTETYRFTVVVLPLPATRPTLQVTRETGMGRFLAHLGFRDLQLESEDFNRAFRIDTDNDRFAYDILNPPTMEWLLTQAPTYPFRFTGNHLITWRSGAIEPEHALQTLTFATNLRDRVPTFVWQG